MKIPKKITFAGKKYKVVFKDTLNKHALKNSSEADAQKIIKSGGEVAAYFDAENELIAIRTGFSRQMTEESFLHELLHVVALYCPELKRFGKEEETVNQLSQILYGILKENKMLR